jgi:hypothetical protein
MRTWMLVAALAILSSANIANGHTVAPQKQVYAADEVVWVGGCGETILLCWGDGTIGSTVVDSNEVRVLHKLSDFDNQQTQFITGAGDKFAVMQARSSTYEISFLDGLLGDIGHKADIDSNRWRWGIGFGKEDSTIWGMNDEGLIKVNAETGKVERAIKISRTGEPSGARISPGGTEYATVQHNIAEGRNADGKRQWKIDFGKGTYAEFTESQAAWPIGVTYVEDMAGEKVRITAINMQTGTKLWTKEGAKYASLAAISDDGKRQLWNSDDSAEIAFLPGKKVLTIDGVHQPLDGTFLQDGKLLACMPAFRKVGEDNDKNTYTMARKSPDLWLIDPDTGKVVGHKQLLRSKARPLYTLICGELPADVSYQQRSITHVFAWGSDPNRTYFSMSLPPALAEKTDPAKVAEGLASGIKKEWDNVSSIEVTDYAAGKFKGKQVLWKQLSNGKNRTFAVYHLWDGHVMWEGMVGLEHDGDLDKVRAILQTCPTGTK